MYYYAAVRKRSDISGVTAALEVGIIITYYCRLVQIPFFFSTRAESFWKEVARRFGSSRRWLGLCV